ncbi:MAG TPA: FkbM family methyltransferase [Candidatus Saccharibacteria bacterium]|nr:FkbM family methyltransferase [Candidatus Saccharibacteria bacterium]HRK93982.1 FkbM family methyltransferase [Candidatus Saccharibacteria bacterium]
MSDTLKDRVYYAQNREDLILESFFINEKKGFYVDVGACHPHVASVTKRFYQKGWKGINIEPQTNLYGLFELERPRDLNLNIGISNKQSTIKLRMYTNNQGLSTFASDLKREHASTKGNKTEQYEDVPIEVVTLKDVLSAHNVKSIQFLKVDVEGYEFEVLKGNDWSAFRPEVVCIEANHIVKNWKPLLKKNGYELTFFDGLNEYYTDKYTDRAKKFDYVQHVVIDLKGGISSDDYDILYESNRDQAAATNADQASQPGRRDGLAGRLKSMVRRRR